MTSYTWLKFFTQSVLLKDNADKSHFNLFYDTSGQLSLKRVLPC